MLYGKYTFICRLKTTTILPYYKGSTIRGVFGHALKKVVCALKRQACESCLLKEKCLYAQVFETQMIRDSGTNTRISSNPHPFVIEPPLEQKTEYRPGDTFECNLILFGECNEKLPYFIYAFDQMGKIGIGKRINGKRGQFSLQKALLGSDPVYLENEEKISMPDAFESLSVSESVGRTDETLKVRVTLKTPLRFKFKGSLNDGLPFHILVRAMLRRMSSLMNAYGSGEPPLDYKGLVERAGKVSIMESKLNWFDWRRYSQRQDRTMFMGGITGSVTYEGEMSEYLPLLDFCTKVHIGKNTSFGLGDIGVEIVP